MSAAIHGNTHCEQHEHDRREQHEQLEHLQGGGAGQQPPDQGEDHLAVSESSFGVPSDAGIQ